MASSSPAALPTDLAQIDARWLERALQGRFPGVRLATCAFAETRQGTSTKALLRIGYADRAGHAGLPATLWLKGNFATDRQFMAELGIYLDEVRFYRDLQAQLAINTPRCFYAQSDDCGQGILLLEDLRQKNVRIGGGNDSMTEASAAQLLEMLAVLHARWWQSPALDGELAWAVDPLSDGPAGAYYRAMREPATWAQRCTQIHALGVPRSLRDPGNVMPAMERLQQLDRREPLCLLHGDAHFGNLYVEPDGRPGLFDWQCLRRGPWAHDVNYALVSVLDSGDRRAWEQDLLRHYLAALQREFERLQRPLHAPEFDAAWRAYRQQTLYGLFMWTCNTEALQPVENNIAFTLRYAIAALDHQTLQLLR